MSPISKGLASFAVAAALSLPAGAQVLTQKNVSVAMAQTIANAALAQCESMGFKVSVTVLDRDGLAVVMRAATAQACTRRKAATARPTRRAPIARHRPISPSA